MNKYNNLLFYIKKNWKKLLLLFIILTFVYSKYASYKIAKSVEKVLADNEFVNYTLEEYIEFFETCGFEANYTIDGNNSSIVGIKDNKLIHIKYDYSIKGQKDFRFENIHESYLPLIEGINSDDTFDEVKRKLHLNPFITMYNFIIYQKYEVILTDSYILITDGSEDSNYAYYMLSFNEQGNIDKLLIDCLGLEK